MRQGLSMSRPAKGQTTLHTLGLGSLALLGYAVEAALLGAAIVPGVFLCRLLWLHTAASPLWARVLWICMVGAASYFLYGFTLILLVGLLRSILRLNLHEGSYPLVSAEAAKWALNTALKSPVSITFLNVLLPSPFAACFLRVMGARIGRGVRINSTSCADPSLLEIGDRSVIGGHATIVGHLVEEGRLMLKRVRIGRDVVVGLNAIILPGAEIADGAVIAAGAIVPKEGHIAPGSVYLGAPLNRQAHARHPMPGRRRVCAPAPEVVESWR